MAIANPDSVVFLGIDPGAKGGLALISYSRKILSLAQFNDREPLEVIKEALSGVEEDTYIHVAVESVHSFPGQGISSAFTFGTSYGKLLGFFYALGMDTVGYSPQEWQKYLPPADTGKGRVARFVEQERLTREFIFEGCRVPHDGCVDAFGIADYHRKVVLGKIVRSVKARRTPVKKRRPMKF
jgi:hypothetical protein